MKPRKEVSPRLWIYLIVLIILSFTHPTALQAAVEKLMFSELVAQADRIVVAQVIDLTSHWDKEKVSIVTTVTLEIRESLKGKEEANTIQVEIPGGQIDGLILEVSDTPSFIPGEEVVLFLQAEGFPIVGWFQGKFTLVNDRVQGIDVPFSQFKNRVTEIMTAQQNGIPVDFDWESIPPESPLETAWTPQITGIAPASGPARGDAGRCADNATVVTIKGNNFGASQGLSRVLFEKSAGCIVSWSNTVIVVKVSGETSSGKVKIETLTSISNEVDFFVPYSTMSCKWNTNTVGYKINPNTGDLSGEETPVISGADPWNKASNGNFRFHYLGTTQKSGFARDQENTISWGNTNNSIATTRSWCETNNPNGYIEFDIVFNDNYNWGSDGGSGKMDIQHVATHEFGHGLGLSDLYGNADGAKTMYGHTYEGEIQNRTLEPDDIAGMRDLYPCSPPNDGIVLYEHSNHTGKCATFTGNDSDLADNGFNDMASSIQFRGTYANGIQATVYENNNYNGTNTSFRNNDADFGNDAIGHDRTSSLQLSGICPHITAWKGEYWNNQTLSNRPLSCRNDSNVNFNWSTGGPGELIPPDHFSARWTRNLDFNAGTYRFHIKADDGVRLWIDNALVVDKWVDQGATEYTVDRSLSSGSHSVKIEYYENGNDALIQFWYEQIAVCPNIAQWKGEYWNNRNLDGNPILCRNDENVNFDWGNGNPGNGVPADNFSARWTRTINFNTGTYKFHLKGDDGIRLWVDGVLIIDAWRDQGPTEYTSEKYLSSGNHSLKVEFYENGGGALVQLWWEQINPGNLALNRRAQATSQESTSYPAAKGNDGNTGTRWSSRSSTANEWWWVDLGSVQTFDKVVIRWETAYAVKHFVGWSNDGINFTGYWYTINSPGNYLYNLNSRTARYVGIMMQQHASCCGNYSFWEFEVYRTVVLSENHSPAEILEIPEVMSDTSPLSSEGEIVTLEAPESMK